MKEKSEEIDINEEYEKLVPPTVRKSLYDEGEDYESLREYIMAQPVTFLSKQNLPFKDVVLLECVPYKFSEEVDKATEEHKHLFFIRQSEKGQPEYCNAAGYYSKAFDRFNILPYSYIVNRAYGEMPHASIRLGNKKQDGCNHYITSSVVFPNPERAATFVLGQKAGLDEWVDRRGKGLLEYYPKHASMSVVDTLFPMIPTVSVTSTTTSEKHIFHIFVKGICKARGYFNAEKAHFFILKDSMLALDTDPDYEKSPLGTARGRLLASYCIRNSDFYIVNKDTKCRSASAAASYVLGRNTSYMEWEDDYGKGLRDLFPEYFHMKKDKSQSLDLFSEVVRSEEDLHLSYIRKQGESGRACNAEGYYDAKTKTFVLKKGSRWAPDVTKAYLFTASESVRHNHIMRGCNIQGVDIIQTYDILCDSPSAAASFVLGRSANGWDEWKDLHGNTLRDIYKDDGAEDAQKKKELSEIVSLLLTPARNVIGTLHSSVSILHQLLTAIRDH